MKFSHMKVPYFLLILKVYGLLWFFFQTFFLTIVTCMIVVGIIDWQDRGCLCKIKCYVQIIYILESLFVAFYTTVGITIIIIFYSFYSWS